MKGGRFKNGGGGGCDGFVGGLCQFGGPVGDGYIGATDG